MQLSCVRLSVDRVLRSLIIFAAPVSVELLQHVLVLAQRTSGQLRVLSVDIDAPTVARVDQAASILWNVLDLQGLRQLTALCRALRADVDRGLTLAEGQREELSPLLGSWTKKRISEC